MFTKEERSTFSYWFAHWCAFQMTALNLRIWEPKYLLHDVEKPWLKLFKSYDKVQSFHNKYAKHHLIHYMRTDEFDIDAWIIDNECSRFTKNAASYVGVVEKLYSSFNIYEDFLYTWNKPENNKLINWICSSDCNLTTLQIAYKLRSIYYKINNRLKELGFIISPKNDYLNDFIKNNEKQNLMFS